MDELVQEFFDAALPTLRAGERPSGSDPRVFEFRGRKYIHIMRAASSPISRATMLRMDLMPYDEYVSKKYRHCMTCGREILDDDREELESRIHALERLCTAFVRKSLPELDMEVRKVANNEEIERILEVLE